MQVVSKDVWLKERMALLRREKMVTRELDLLALERQKMPWVKVEKDYQLETSEGSISLNDLFGSYAQLIVYHFMFGPEWPEPCDGCTGWADAFNGTLDQIQNNNANLIAVSRAPFEKLDQVKKSKNWNFTWASSFNSDFNSDFNMSGPIDQKTLLVGDEEIMYDRGESGGINVFVKTTDGIFLSYSCHNRGIQQMNGAYGYVDLLPYGGN